MNKKRKPKNMEELTKDFEKLTKDKELQENKELFEKGINKLSKPKQDSKDSEK